MNKLKLINRMPISITVLIILILVHFIYKYDLCFLINDEIIFDLILIGLLLAINNFLTESNTKELVASETNTIMTLSLLFHNLLTLRYLIYRSKKIYEVNMVHIIKYLNSIQSSIFHNCAGLSYYNVLISFKNVLVQKLNTSVNLKNTNLMNLLKFFLDNKLSHSI